MAQQNQLVQVNKQKMNTLKEILNKALPTINAVLPKHMTGERMIKIVAAAASRQPELLECTPMSIIQSVVIASQMGLEPVGPLGQAYLMPFNNRKNGQKEAQFVPGYRGFVDLAFRSGIILDAHPVRERDIFEFQFGLDQKLDHKPYIGRDIPGEVIAAYAIARFSDGRNKFDVMTRLEIDAIKARSKAANYGPWQTDYDEMARKTAVRRLCKMIPLSTELSNAIAADTAVETGMSQIESLYIDVPDDVTIDTDYAESHVVSSKADEIADKITANGKGELL